MVVRRLLHRAGYRYRLHRRDLPGKPDIIFTSRRKVILVHGCFWHQHDLAACLDGRKPKSNTNYWHPKLARNVERDQQNLERLTTAGWRVLVVWECEVKNEEALTEMLTAFLSTPKEKTK